MAAFRVIQQRMTSKLSPAGGFVDGNEITFQIDSGTTGSVFIPRNRITDTDYVRTQIAEHADALAAIETLS